MMFDGVDTVGLHALRLLARKRAPGAQTGLTEAAVKATFNRKSPLLSVTTQRRQ